MPRTLVNLDDDDKRWLDDEASRRHVPMTEMVREAVREYRARSQSLERYDLQGELARTVGIWKHGDGLAYQQRRREEWERRS